MMMMMMMTMMGRRSGVVVGACWRCCLLTTLLLVVASAAAANTPPSPPMTTASSKHGHHHYPNPPPGPFDPYKFDFRALWTAYPQRPASRNVSVLATGPYTLCSFANCTVIPNTSPPIAECGCVGFATPDEFNTTKGNTQNVLDRALVVSTLKVCSDPAVDCPDNAGNPTPYARATLYGEVGSGFGSGSGSVVARMYSALPRAQGGQGSLARRVWRQANAADAQGNLRLGWDLISGFNGGTWPSWTDPYTQGSSADGTQTCEQGGVYAMCYSVGCLRRPAFNGMPYTCYCPWYRTRGAFILPAGPGYACGGLRGADGRLRFLGSGCEYGCATPLPSASPASVHAPVPPAP